MGWSFRTSHVASSEQASEVWSKGTNAEKMGELTAAKGAQTKGRGSELMEAQDSRRSFLGMKGQGEPIGPGQNQAAVSCVWGHCPGLTMLTQMLLPPGHPSAVPASLKSSHLLDCYLPLLLPHVCSCELGPFCILRAEILAGPQSSPPTHPIWSAASLTGLPVPNP